MMKILEGSENEAPGTILLNKLNELI